MAKAHLETDADRDEPPETLTEIMLRILQLDDPVKAEADAHGMIEAAAIFLWGRHGEEATLVMLVQHAERLRNAAYLGRCQPPAGMPLQ